MSISEYYASSRVERSCGSLLELGVKNLKRIIEQPKSLFLGGSLGYAMSGFGAAFSLGIASAYLFLQWEKQNNNKIEKENIKVLYPSPRIKESDYQCQEVEGIPVNYISFMPIDLVAQEALHIDGEKIEKLTEEEVNLSKKIFKIQILGDSSIAQKVGGKLAQIASDLLLHGKIWSDYVPNTLEGYEKNFEENRNLVNQKCLILSKKIFLYLTKKTGSLSTIKKKFNDHIEEIGIFVNPNTKQHSLYHKNQSNQKHSFRGNFIGDWHAILVGKLKSGESFAIDSLGLYFLNAEKQATPALMQVFIASSSSQLKTLIDKRYLTNRKWVNHKENHDYSRGHQYYEMEEMDYLRLVGHKGLTFAI